MRTGATFATGPDPSVSVDESGQEVKETVSQVKVRWHASTLKKQFSPTWTQAIAPSIFLPTFREEDYPQSQSFLRIYSEPLHILGAKGGDVHPLGSLWSSWEEKKKTQDGTREFGREKGMRSKLNWESVPLRAKEGTGCVGTPGVREDGDSCQIDPKERFPCCLSTPSAFGSAAPTSCVSLLHSAAEANMSRWGYSLPGMWDYATGIPWAWAIIHLSWS